MVPSWLRRRQAYGAFIASLAAYAMFLFARRLLRGVLA